MYAHAVSTDRALCVFWQYGTYLSKSIQTVHRLTTYSREFTTNASLFRDRGIVTKAWNEPGRQAILGRNVVISLATTSLHTHNSGSQQGQGRDPVTTVPT